MHIVETGLTLLHQASVPTEYWTYAFAVAVYLINRQPSSVLPQKSPYAMLFNKTPNYLKLRVFGCACFPWLKPYNSHKLESRSLRCVFLGYSLTQSAYICLHQPTGRIYISRHVKFVESDFPFVTTPSTTSPVEVASQPTFSPPTIIPIPQRIPQPPLVHSPAVPPPGQDPHQQSYQTTTSESFASTEQTTNVGNGLDSTGTSQGTQTIPPSDLQPTASEPENANPSTQQDTLHPDPTHANPHQLNAHPMKTRSKNNISKPTKKLTLTSTVTKPHIPIPTTIHQAMRDEKWRRSMSLEYDAQVANQTFELVPPKPNQNVIGSKWIHTLKYLADGTLNRYKSRWFTRGYNQEYGIDYGETFSPVVKSVTNLLSV